MTERLVDVDGIRLAMTVSGLDAAPPPLVYLHGLTGTAAEWNTVRDLLGGRYRHVAFSRAGVGGSDPLPAEQAAAPVAVGWAVDQLRGFLAAADITTPPILVGHSVGGLIADVYARVWPQEVAGLVLVEPTPPAFWAAATRGTDTDAPGRGVTFDPVATAAQVRIDWPSVQLPAVVVSAHESRWQRIEDPQNYLLPVDELGRRWHASQYEWAHKLDAGHLLALDVGHAVHKEAPLLVAIAVETVYRKVRMQGQPEAVPIDSKAVSAAGGIMLFDPERAGGT